MMNHSSPPRSIITGALLVLLAASCDKGIEPSASPSLVGTFTGRITFANWDSAGALFDLRLVAARGFPLSANVLNEILAGRIVAYPPPNDTSHLPYNVDSVRYAFTLGAGTWEYVGVAQQFGPNLNQDWRAVGQYDLDSNLTIPTPVLVAANETTYNIDIHVDFANLPPSPFR